MIYRLQITKQIWNNRSFDGDCAIAHDIITVPDDMIDEYSCIITNLMMTYTSFSHAVRETNKNVKVYLYLNIGICYGKFWLRSVNNEKNIQMNDIILILNNFILKLLRLLQNTHKTIFRKRSDLSLWTLYELLKELVSFKKVKK